jgi:hypothetical protein
VYWLLETAVIVQYVFKVFLAQFFVFDFHLFRHRAFAAGKFFHLIFDVFHVLTSQDAGIVIR